MSNHPKWEVTRDRRDGKWIEGHGTEFPPLGHMSQPHESAVFNRLDLGQSYRYTNGAWVLEGSGEPGAGLTVQEVDGVPSAVSVDTIQFDQADGFVLTDLGAGDVRLDLSGVPEARLSLSFATHSSANDPSAGQKAALAGTSGVPGVGNEYVTDDDVRNADARPPTVHDIQGAAHNASGLTGGHVLRASGAAAFSFAAIQDADLPATIARDSEITAAVSAHEGAADPHTAYQRESEKGAAGGYASLDGGTLVPVAQLPAATTAAKGVVELATDGESAASVAVQGNDARLSNARTPTAHAASHQDAGSDEINVAGLAGLLVTPQTPAAHATAHQNGGADEISVVGLSGLLADGQTPLAHKTSHQDGGADELSVAGLAGLLADQQTPLTHDIITKHNGFPGGTSTFLRADAAFAAPTASVALSSVDIAFTDGDVMRRVTITDGGILATSKITGSIRRPDVEDADDRGYIYIHNIVKVAAGSFDMLVAALGWGFDDPTAIPPNETVKFYYMAS